ncbi:hypothetical protein [Aeromonas hydrophila]
MDERKESIIFIDALSRWKESCVFYFKLDLALITAIAAILSYFKIEGDKIFQVASEYKLQLYVLIVLLIYTLFYEMIITNTSNRKDLALLLSDEKKRKWIYHGFTWAYAFLALSHIFLITYSFAYASGYVDVFMEYRRVQ